MSDADTQSKKPTMTTGKAFLIYLGCLVVMLVLFSITLAFKTFPAFIVISTYFIMGFLLNRIVLRGLVVWHPVYNTLDNVSAGKLSMFGFWPIRYPDLFIKLLVSKHL